MPDPSDITYTKAKDHLANERTFLAWIRTCVGIMAFGFVVERFALFISKLEFLLEGLRINIPQTPSHLHGYASLFGVILVALGAILTVLAYIKYRSTAKQIDNEIYQPSPFLNMLLTLIVLGTGIFLVLYLKNPL